MPPGRLELPRPRTTDFESAASTSSTTGALGDNTRFFKIVKYNLIDLVVYRKKLLANFPYDFLLKQHNPVYKRFSAWGASWNIDIDRYNIVAASGYRIGIMIIATAIGTASHRNNPARLWHLVVNFAKCWGHFVC